MARLVPLLLTLAALCALARAKVTPRVDCVCAQSATQTRVRFAYKNDNDDKTLAAGSSQNYMTPGALSQGQPSHFEEGSHLAHSVLIDCVASPGGVAWIVQSGSTSTLRSALAPCVATPSCVADQCGPPQPEWSQIGPLRGDSATESAVAFPAPQVLRELDGPHAGTLVAVDNAVLRIGTKRSSAWEAVSQQTLVSTKRESTMTLMPSVLYMEEHPLNNSIVCKVAVTQSAWRAVPSSTAITAAELVWRTNVECSQNGGKDFDLKVYETTATPSGLLVDEQANCLTITEAGVIIICLNNARVPAQSGILRSTTPLVRGSYSLVTPVAGGAFFSSIKQKPAVSATLYAFGYDRATRTQFGWLSLDAGLTMPTVTLTAASSAAVPADGALINSIKAAVSSAPAHSQRVCIVAQGRDPNTGVRGGELFRGCSTNGAATWALTSPATSAPDTLAPNPETAYPFLPPLGAGVLAFSPNYDLNRASSPIAIMSTGVVLIGFRHAFRSSDLLQTVTQFSYGAPSVRNYIHDVRVTASDDDDYSCSGNHRSHSAKRDRTVLSTELGPFVAKSNALNFKPYKRSDEMLALLDLGHWRVERVRVHPTLPETVFTMNQGGLYASKNSGTDMRSAVGTAPLSNFMDVAFSRQNPRLMYGLMSIRFESSNVPTGTPTPTRILVSMTTNGDAQDPTWTPTCLDITYPFVSTRTNRTANVLQIDVNDDGIVYMESQVGIFKISNHGATCVNIVPTFPGGTMIMKPGSSSVLYACATVNGLFATRDAGNSFSALSLPSQVTILGPATLQGPTAAISTRLDGDILVYSPQINAIVASPTCTAQLVLASSTGLPLAPGALVGKIAVIPNPTGGSVDYRPAVLNAGAAGACGAIVISDVGGGPIQARINMQFTPSIPAIIAPSFRGFGVPLIALMALQPVYAKFVVPAAAAPGVPVSDVRNANAMGMCALGVSERNPEMLYVSAGAGLAYRSGLWVSHDSAVADWTPIIDETTTDDVSLLSQSARLNSLDSPFNDVSASTLAVNPLNEYELIVGWANVYKVTVKTPVARNNFDVEWLFKVPSASSSALQRSAGHVLHAEWARDGSKLYLAGANGVYRVRKTQVSSGVQAIHYNGRTRKGLPLGAYWSIESSQRDETSILASRHFAVTSVLGGIVSTGASGHLVRRSDLSWQRVDAGNIASAYAAKFDSRNDSKLYLGFQLNPLVRVEDSTDRALSVVSPPVLLPQPPNPFPVFMSRYSIPVQDLTTPSTFYIMASYFPAPPLPVPRILVSYDNTLTWSILVTPAVPAILTGIVIGGKIKTTRADPDTLYALFSTSQTNIAITNPRSATAPSTNGFNGFVLRYKISTGTYTVSPVVKTIYDICVSQTNADSFVLVSGQGTTDPQVYRGTSFPGNLALTDITGSGIGNFMLSSCLIDDTYASRGESIYVASMFGGVYNLKNGSTTWSTVNVGLPPGAQVTFLSMYNAKRILRCATLGSGLFETRLIDCDECRTEQISDDEDDDDHHHGRSVSDALAAVTRDVADGIDGSEALIPSIFDYGTPNYVADVFQQRVAASAPTASEEFVAPAA